MIKRTVLLLLSSTFSLNALAQTGLQSPVTTTFVVSSSISSKEAACGPDDEVHLQYLTQFGTVAIATKKVGGTAWTTKALNQVSDSTATTSRDAPALHVYPSGYGCIIWQSSKKTLISTKSPLQAQWSNAESLGDISSGQLQIDAGADCGVNDNGEVIAVWRDAANIYESFRDAQGVWTPKRVIKGGLTGAADHIFRFKLLISNLEAKFFYSIFNSSLGEAIASMTRSSTGDWTEQAPIVPRRSGGYYLGDLSFEPALNKGILTLMFGKDNGDIANAGYYSSIFDLSSTPVFNLISGSGATTQSGGIEVSTRNLSGNFVFAAPYSFENPQTIDSRIRLGSEDLLLSSITKESDPDVQVFGGEVSAALSGVNSILALSSTTRTKQDPENSLGLESAVSRLIASIIKNNQKTDTVLREDSGSDFVYGYSPVVAACSGGSGTLAYVKGDGIIVSVDYINDSTTDPVITPVVPAPGTQTPGTQTPSVPVPGADSCPDDITKTSAGICGCGKADLDINSDTLIDCGSPRLFIKNIVPKIVSATPDGKGKLIVQVEGLSGSKLKYTLSVKGKKYSKDFNASKLKVNLKKLPAGVVTLKLKITQKSGKKTIKSKSSAAFKATVL